MPSGKELAEQRNELSPHARQRFLHNVTSGTSHLRAEFLRCALAGEFAEPVALLVRCLFVTEPSERQAQACALGVVGHSSGIDAMVGMVLGCRSLSGSLDFSS